MHLLVGEGNTGAALALVTLQKWPFNCLALPEHWKLTYNGQSNKHTDMTTFSCPFVMQNLPDWDHHLFCWYFFQHHLSLLSSEMHFNRCAIVSVVPFFYINHITSATTDQNGGDTAAAQVAIACNWLLAGLLAVAAATRQVQRGGMRKGCCEGWRADEGSARAEKWWERGS